MQVNVTGLDGVLDALQKMPPEIVSKRGGPVSIALRRAANLIGKQAKSNLRISINAPGKTGITKSTGLLLKSIRAFRKRPPPGVKGEFYRLGTRYAPYPDRKSYYAVNKVSGKGRNRKIDTKTTAYFLEYGNKYQAALPWLRPAFESKKQEAIDNIDRYVKEAIDKAFKKYAKGR